MSKRINLEDLTDLRIEQIKKEDGYRSTKIYPSEVCSDYFCTRQDYLLSELAKQEITIKWIKPDNSVQIVKPVDVVENNLSDNRLQKVFDTGHVLHDLWRNVYLGPLGVLLGQWECIKCDRVVEGRQPEIPCACWGRNIPPKRKFYWNYVESRVQSDAWGIPLSGKKDGMLDVERMRKLINVHLPNVESILFDLKTISDRGYNWLNKAQQSAVRQVNLYLHVEKGEYGIIWYVNKSDSEEKVFLIEYSEKVQAETEIRIQEKVAYLKNPEALPEIPKRNTKSSKTCKYCPVSTLCRQVETEKDLINLETEYGYLVQ
jgi:hypothetical protein